MINILIVDDHALVRHGMKRLLEDIPDMQVVAEAENGEQALMLVKNHKPDIILLDMKMPGIDGWEVTRRLKKSHPQIKIIAVTALASDSLPGRILQLGAMGYLNKESSIEEIASAIHKVHEGELYLSTEIAQKMAINSLKESKNTPFDLLSEREMQVVLMITAGLSVQHISDSLFLSTKTVNGHRYKIFEKLNIKNGVELAYLAIKHSIIEAPEHAD